MQSLFKGRLGRGDVLVGTILTIPSAEIAEIFQLAGFDWLFVDLEHGAMGIRDAQTAMQAAGEQLPCVVRVPANDEVWIKRALDIGAAGIIAPNVRSAEAARQVVRLCKYPPEGERSVGIARAQGYGEAFQAYVSTANEAVAVIIQIEHVDAVAAIEEIIAVAGIDAVFVGPYDLSASMGKMGLTTDPKVQEAIRKVKQGTEAARIPIGIFGPTAESVRPYIQEGYTLIAVGTDTLMLVNAAKNITGALKR
jgi:2-keto-3-deoxy-L-rhamnonate aldolase RhmA